MFQPRTGSRDVAFRSEEDSCIVLEEEPGEERVPSVLERGGFVMLWCIGIFTIIKMIIWFEATLKPAVFALFFVICLEPSVKTFTRVFLCIPCRGGGFRSEVVEGDEVESLGDNQYFQFLARLVAVVVVLALVSSMVWLFLLICLEEAEQLSTNASIYTDGLRELYTSALRTFNNTAAQLPEQMAENFRKQVSVLDLSAGKIPAWVQTAQDWFAELANSLISSLGTLSTQVVLCFLYVLFALCQPPKGELPGQIEAIVRRFIFLKTLTNALFAVCVALLLWMLDVDLAGLFGLLSWFLNFIPELGPFISMALPLPLVMLDSRMRVDERLRIVLLILVGQLIIKFIVGNIIETYLFGHDARFGEVHPVVVMLFAMLCGEIWGAFGMLVSVPLLALLKLLLDDSLREKIHEGQSNRYRHVSEVLARGLRGETSVRYSIIPGISTRQRVHTTL
eukprot:gnl/MRDRNA2_/MRDRNA2_88091_c0_seq1.p1 gnl/MRDRNA2_/MRDRNA2_88091_c0~~gnl/MRDRNA2_/MRDRNA2_88091_c0_seq1.p1  ORF type:complete len:450 (+),score=68.78 gnl/MRDRNA2_/MRDRNA2_88091_c0_seq1:80-1429(+)